MFWFFHTDVLYFFIRLTFCSLASFIILKFVYNKVFPCVIVFCQSNAKYKFVVCYQQSCKFEVYYDQSWTKPQIFWQTVFYPELSGLNGRTT